MSVAPGKNNGFANGAVVPDTDTICHQDGQSLFDGILVEDFLIQRRSIDGLGQVSLFIGERVLIGLFFFVRQVS